MDERPDRRLDRRLDFDTAVEFAAGPRWHGGLSQSGRARNVSPSGIYFETDTIPAVAQGGTIALKIVIPSSTLEMLGEAEIVRATRLDAVPRRRLSGVQSEKERWGIAARFHGRPAFSLPE